MFKKAWQYLVQVNRRMDGGLVFWQVAGLIFGLIFGLSAWLSYEPIGGLIVEFVLGLIIGMIVGLTYGLFVGLVWGLGIVAGNAIGTGIIALAGIIGWIPVLINLVAIGLCITLIVRRYYHQKKERAAVNPC